MFTMKSFILICLTALFVGVFADVPTTVEKSVKELSDISEDIIEEITVLMCLHKRKCVNNQLYSIWLLEFGPETGRPYPGADFAVNSREIWPTGIGSGI